MSKRFVVVSALAAATLAVGTGPALAESAHSRAAAGQVMTFGVDEQGTLGNGRPFVSSAMPVSVGRSLSHAVQVSAHAGHMLALRHDGSVWGWGFNRYGQAGPGPRVLGTPTRVPGLAGIVSVDAGGASSFAVAGDGTVYAWGYNRGGELGLGDRKNRSTPSVVPGLPRIVRVSAGLDHVLALAADGSVWAWGHGEYGQLGTGSVSSSNRPVRVAGLPAARAVAAGTTHSLAVGTDGSVWAWGDNEFAQLGDGSRTERDRPVRVPLGSRAKDVSAGDFGSFALMRSGRLKAWGTNAAGQLGISGAAAYVARPRSVACLPRVTAVSSGYNHTLALAADGTVYAWGAAGQGALGIGTASPAAGVQRTPAALTGLHASAVSAGQFVSAVIGRQR